MTVVRELVTKLGFDVDEKKLSGFEKSMGNLRSGLLKVAGVASGIGVGLFAIAQRTANVGDEIAKAARDLGVGVESLQELRFAFEQSGVDSERLDDALKDLNKSIGEAGRGNEAFKESFNSIGVSIRDSNGEIKDTEDILMELSTAFSNVETEAERNAIAQELLGESGIRVATTLAEGQENIIKQRERARDLGGIITEKEAKQAEDFNDTINELKTVFEGFVNEVGIQLIPVIKELADELTEFLLVNRDVISENLVSFFRELAKVFDFIAGTVRFLSSIFDLLVVAFKTALPFVLAWKAGLLAITGPIGLIVTGVISLILFLRELQNRFQIFSKIAGGIKSAASAVGSFFGFGGDDEPEDPNNDAVNQANRRAANNSGRTSSNNNTQNNDNSVNINVEGNADEETIAQMEELGIEVNSDLRRQLEQANNETGSNE